MGVTSFGPGIKLHMFGAPWCTLVHLDVPWCTLDVSSISCSDEAPTLLYYISFDSSKPAQSESSDCLTSINQWDAD